MKILSKNVTIILSAILSAAMLSSCAGGGTSKKASVKINEGLPIVSTPVKMSIYLNNDGSGKIKTYADSESFAELSKRTGVEIEWLHPTVGNEKDQFNLMIASRQLPDMIHWNWNSVPGGYSQAINDNVIIKLNDLIDTYAPNYKKLITANDTIKKQSSLNDGSIPLFLQLEPDPKRMAYGGLQIRRDWLNKLGLKMPTTIDEWYTVLKAFKTSNPNGNGKNDIIPLGDMGGNTFGRFETAFGIRTGFYKDPRDGKIHYGAIDPKYKEFIQTMAKWYNEGLIDPEFASVDRKNFNAKFTSNQVGAYYGWLSGHMAFFINQMKPTNPGIDIVGAPCLVGADGKAYTASDEMLADPAGIGVGITPMCKYPEVAARFLDYCYSQEGSDLLNWGIIGKSYNVIDGKKVFTDEILKNPAGETPFSAAVKYAFPIHGFAKSMDFEAYSQINLTMPQLIESANTWAQADTSLLLPRMDKSSEKNALINNIMNEVNTYQKEMLFKFICGKEPISNFDKYVQTINNMKIDEAVKAMQEAYDNYKNR